MHERRKNRMGSSIECWKSTQISIQIWTEKYSYMYNISLLLNKTVIIFATRKISSTNEHQTWNNQPTNQPTEYELSMYQRVAHADWRTIIFVSFFFFPFGNLCAWMCLLLVFVKTTTAETTVNEEKLSEKWWSEEPKHANPIWKRAWSMMYEEWFDWMETSFHHFRP